MEKKLSIISIRFSENSDIHNIIIWNNSRILIGGKPIFYKPLFQTQIISIKHLLNENNTFLSFDELKQKASINIPFTLYYGLITSIPTEWKKLLRNQNNCPPKVIPTLAPLRDPPSTRTAYPFLLNKVITPPTSENRILNFGFTKENIHKGTKCHSPPCQISHFCYKFMRRQAIFCELSSPPPKPPGDFWNKVIQLQTNHVNLFLYTANCCNAMFRSFSILRHLTEIDVFASVCFAFVCCSFFAPMLG